MTEEIIIDVSSCPHKSDDDCMEVPICNEYGDLMGYQSCEAQTLCPYRSQKKIDRLEQENKANLKQIELDVEHICNLNKQINELEQENKELKEWKYKVVKLFESACRCKYLNEESDICSYINKKCININKCVYKYQELSGAYRSALEEILESAKFAQCLPCGSGNLEDCLNCDDDTTNNGQFCMEKRIHDIKTKCVEVLNHSEG